MTAFQKGDLVTDEAGRFFIIHEYECGYLKVFYARKNGKRDRRSSSYLLKHPSKLKKVWSKGTTGQ